MKILIIEDDSDKKIAVKTAIVDELSKLGVVSNRVQFDYALDLNQARRYLISVLYDLIVFDMFLPESSKSGTEVDCSDELVTEFSQSKNYQSEAIALTQYQISEVEEIQRFNSVGINLVAYDSTGAWKDSLIQKLKRISQKTRYDFVIFTALPKERQAYENTKIVLGEARNISGLDCLDAKIGEYAGVIIKPRRMGLVNMAIIASKAIELFQPKIVAMSGICAGFEGESDYLDIVVGSTCWEYQTGKWKDGVFKQEPYQSELNSSLQIDLEQFAQDRNIINEVRRDQFATKLKEMRIIVAPISSGSAVIADQDIMEKIGGQHRKVAALEMEMYSMYEAASQSLSKPLFFGAKTVVDLGDSNKGDDYQDVGCITSARFVVCSLEKLLNKNI